jgi:hypothetical protein
MLRRAADRIKTDGSILCLDDMIHDLTSLMAPQTPDVFYDHSVRKTRFQVKSADRDRAVPLLPWSTINQLLEAEALPPGRVDFVRASNVISPKIYRKGRETGALRAGTAQNLLRQGSSVLVRGIDSLVPSIGRLTAAIERELSCKVWSNAYLSFGAGSALKAHYDPHDVVILQVHGRKRWSSYGVAVPPHVAAQIIWEDILEPGDVLYLPQGEVHEAALESENSVHLTIGLSSYRGLDFAEAMIKQAVEDDLFRQDVPVAAGKSAIAEHEAALKKALHALIDRTELSSCLDGESRARPLRSFMNLGIAGPFQANTIVEPAVRRRISLDIEIAADVEVLIGGEKFLLSVPARRVLDFLIWHDESTFGAIVSALEPQLAEPLVQRAVAELAKQSLVGLRT